MPKQSRLDRFREHKNEFFAEGDHSPLTKHQRAHFDGLAYFAEQPALAFELPLDQSGPDIGQQIMLGATDGTAKPFVRAGRVTFPVNGEQVTLLVFREPDRGRYYLPFRDGTAGNETYAVGRYLDPQARPNGDLVVDFNYAYNPYCAYNDGWSCPIPPRENVTPVRIEAGEKLFPGEDRAGE